MKRWHKIGGIVLVSLFAVFFVGACETSTGGGALKKASNVNFKAPPQGVPYNLTILHTNDLHGNTLPFGRHNLGGQARHAWLIRKIRSLNESKNIATIVLDAGDTRDGTVFNDATRGAGLWHIMNMIGYDAVAMGNHDHLFGIKAMYDDLTAAFADDITTDGSGNPVYGQKTKVVWGNVNPTRINMCTTDTGGRFVRLPDVVKNSLENAFMPPNPADDPCLAESYPATIERNLMTPPEDSTSKLFNQTLFYDYDLNDDGVRDLRVGLFGITTDEVIYTFVPAEPMEMAGVELPAGVTGEGAIFYSTDPRNSNYVNQVIDYLDDPDGNPATDDGADVIICLSHTGTDKEIDIARYARGPKWGRYIDVLVGGHSHTLINKAIEIDHGAGVKKSWVVQADWGGMFLGREDLYIHGGQVDLVNSGLIQVDSSIPEAKDVKNYIEDEFQKPGGVNDWFTATYGVSPEDPLGYSEVNLNPDNFNGETPLANLIANAFFWEGHENSIFTIPDNGNPLAGQPGYTDFAVMVPFVVHTGDIRIRQEGLSVSTIFDTLHIHDLTPDPTHVNTLHIIELAPLPPGGLDLGGIHFDSQLDLFLEVVYGLPDLIAGLGEEDIASMIQSYIGDLQWAGISFVVDFDADPFDRIDSSTIVVNDQPAQADRYYYLSLNSTIARFLGALEPLIDSMIGDFMNWDPAWSETNVPEWVALMDYVKNALPNGTITPDAVAVKGDTVRSVQPDLTLNPWDISFDPPKPARGDTVEIRAWIINTGQTPVYEANVVYTYDPTPDRQDDNPDGYTDNETGFYSGYIGTDWVRNIPAYSNHPGIQATDGIQWKVPNDLKPGTYMICPEIRNLVSSKAEAFTGNNSGRGLCATLDIR